MIGYVLDYHNFAVKDILEFSEYSYVTDATYAQTSSVNLIKRPNIDRRDYFVGYEGTFDKRLTDAAGAWLTDASDYHLTIDSNLSPAVMGICQEVTENNGVYGLILAQMQRLFDRPVIAEDEILRETSIEEYLANLIRRNFISSGDIYTNLPYLELHTYTSTVWSRSLADGNGLINITSAAAQLLQAEGLRVDMIPLPGKLHIGIYVEEKTLRLKDSAPDVISFTESRDVSMVTAITVKWKLTDESGQFGAITYPAFYLRSDGILTMDPADPERIDGEATTIYQQAASMEALKNLIQERFDQNRYEHKIELTILKRGIYSMSQYRTGRRVQIWVGKNVYKSYISQITIDAVSPAFQIILGNLPVSLSDKIRSWIHGEL